MKSMRYEVTELCLRTDLNLLYLTSKFIVNILDMAETMPLARQALRTAAEQLFTQAADAYGRILRDYGDEVSEPDEEMVHLQKEPDKLY